MARGRARDTLGKRVRWVRQTRGLEQQELARYIEVTIQYLSAIENDRVDPRASVVVRLATALTCSADYLLFGIGERDVVGGEDPDDDLEGAALAVPGSSDQSGRMSENVDSKRVDGSQPTTDNFPY